MLSIPPWSTRGSNVTAITRPWTGIVRQSDGVNILVYCKAARREEAAELLAKQATAFGGELLALMFGHHDDLILKVEVA